MEPEPPGAVFFAWSRSRPTGAGAAQKSGGSATLLQSMVIADLFWGIIADPNPSLTDPTIDWVINCQKSL